MKNFFKNNSLILYIFLFLMLIVSSEAVYAFNNPDVLSSYFLKSAKFISKNNRTSFAFFVLTKFRHKLPESANMEKKVNEYLESVPDDIFFPRLNYELSIIMFDDGHDSLISQLLMDSIKRDSDFSFWYVELANYHLNKGDRANAEKVINTCMELPAPRQHCIDYKNSDFAEGITHPVGFLQEYIKPFYMTKLQ